MKADVERDDPDSSAPVLVTADWRVRLSRAVSALLIRHGFRGMSRLRRLIARILMPRPRGPIVVPTSVGCVLLVDPLFDRGVEREVYYHGIYEAGTIEVLQALLRPGDSFLDIGANVGLMSLAAAQAVGPRGRVYAFEPVPATAALLERNVTLNGFRNIAIQRMALGSTQETRPIYERLNVNRGAASLVPAEGPATATVTVSTLDDFLRNHSVSQIRVAKIDVEGWEGEVLAGGRELLASPAAPALIVEYSMSVRRSRGEPVDVYRYLREVNDYRVFRLAHGKESISRLQEIGDIRDLPREDNLVCLRPDHLLEPVVGRLLARS